MNKNIRQYKVVLIVLLLISVSFEAGLYLGNPQKSRQTSEQFKVINATSTAKSIVNMDPFWTVWKTLDDKFVYTHADAKKITDQDKMWGAIEGLASSYGDPYTVFMPPEEAKSFASDISGNFEGVGMELAIKDKNIVVVAPIKGTPAYNAGVKKGDIIISINGTSTEGMSVEEAVSNIRGKAGTEVTISFTRIGVANPIKLTMKREVIAVPTVETEIKSDVFVIKLYSFNALSADKFRNALRDFIDSGKYKLILDLRGNPGGYLESAVDMASWFLPLGKTVVKENFGPDIDEVIYRSKGYDIFTEKLKMYILADNGSASSAEILAGALQENGVAQIVGTRTFGKGSVQELVPITSDTALKVTIARWLTPKGNSISDNGLKPDFEVELTDKDVAAGNDPQMQRAIKLLENY